MAFTLRAWRVNNNLTIPQAAEKIGVSANTLQKWETGETSPKVEYVFRICKVYGAPSYADIIFPCSETTQECVKKEEE